MRVHKVYGRQPQRTFLHEALVDLGALILLAVIVLFAAGCGGIKIPPELEPPDKPTCSDSRPCNCKYFSVEDPIGWRVVECGPDPSPTTPPSAPPTPSPSPLPSPTPVPSPSSTPTPSTAPSATPSAPPTSPPDCQPEKRRGIGVQYVNRKSKQQCRGTEACYAWFSAGNAQVGDEAVFDSTALVVQGEPVADGCGTCTEDPTEWRVAGVTSLAKPDGPCGLSVKFLARSSDWTITACGDNPATCVTKPDKGKWVVR